MDTWLGGMGLRGGSLRRWNLSGGGMCLAWVCCIDLEPGESCKYCVWSGLNWRFGWKVEDICGWIFAILKAGFWS